MIRGLWLAATLLLASAPLAAAEFRQVKGGRIASRLMGKSFTRREKDGVGTRMRHRARRAGDMAFRIGGEEFALLLGGTDAHDAHRTTTERRARIFLLVDTT